MTKATKEQKCAMCAKVAPSINMHRVRTLGVGFEDYCPKCYAKWEAYRYPRSEKAKRYFAEHGF